MYEAEILKAAHLGKAKAVAELLREPAQRKAAEEGGSIRA
jgi:hypothetical protein